MTSDPIRLTAIAAELGVSVETLRRHARDGELVIWRVAGKHWTSRDEVRRMFERCRVEPNAPRSSGARSESKAETASAPSGSSATEATAKALAAALATADRLIYGSAATSRKKR